MQRSANNAAKSFAPKLKTVESAVDSVEAEVRRRCVDALPCGAHVGTNVDRGPQVAKLIDQLHSAAAIYASQQSAVADELQRLMCTPKPSDRDTADQAMAL